MLICPLVPGRGGGSEFIPILTGLSHSPTPLWSLPYVRKSAKSISFQSNVSFSFCIFHALLLYFSLFLLYLNQKVKKYLKYFFLFWFALHALLFALSGNFPFSLRNSFFFPFERYSAYYPNSVFHGNFFDLKNYDYEEFLIYFILPLFFLFLINRWDKVLLNFLPKSNSKLDGIINSKIKLLTRRFFSIYILWFSIHFLFLLIGGDSHNYYFWPFYDGNLLEGISDYYGLFEFIVYAFFLPLILFVSIRLWNPSD